MSGLVHRDQMVGPWQVPVADCGVTLRDYEGLAGEAMAIGEKAPLALIDGASSARMAVCEALTNIAGNNIGEMLNIKLSANWMAASGIGREDQVMYEAAHAIGEELCPELGIGIPVGKDSLSMNTQWNDGKDKQVLSPVSLLISAFANIDNVTRSLTPYFDRNNKHCFYYLDIAAGKKRLGVSSLAQVYSQLGDEVPDLDNVENFKQFWQIMQSGVSQEIISAYHDISDGGLFVTVLEMCMASQSGLTINLDFSSFDTLAVLFAEELGSVVAIDEKNIESFERLIANHELSEHIHKLGESEDTNSLTFEHNNKIVFKDTLGELQKKWSQTSHWMASLRDNPESCEQEFALISEEDKGLSPVVNFEYDKSVVAPYINTVKPKVAILREQGVNGQKEMAMAFHRAGFDSYDVHMQDLLDGKVDLMDFQGMAACGGFSYGDVLGAGKGWANSILFHENIKKNFAEYFADENKFTLGVCNGCQMLSSLKEIIPGTENWPEFLKNTSQQFEARFSSVAIEQGNSIFFAGMQGARIPVAIAHGEGRAIFSENGAENIVASYVDNNGNMTQRYPFNPNGSQQAAAAVSNKYGNVLIMMPHPERVFRSVQMSWAAKHGKDNSPWMRMFYNARKFIG